MVDFEADTHFDIQTFVAHLTNHPGVYRMMDKRGTIIYIGKAKNLKKRVSTYFSPRPKDHKTTLMVTHVARVEVTLTRSEAEALLLESTLIKKHKPRYNVILKDDKSYPYLLITKEIFPKIIFHRGAQTLAGHYFGPFPHTRAARETLVLIRKIFKLRSCDNHVFSNRSRPCLEYQIKRCTAPCVSYTDATHYEEQVQHAILFLKGKTEAILEILAKKMEVEAADLRFEAAARLRDQISVLKQAQKQQIIVNLKGNIDIIAPLEQDGMTVFYVLMVREGRVLGGKPFFIHGQIAAGKSLIREFLAQYYLSATRVSYPEEIVLTEKMREVALFEEALFDAAHQKIRVIVQPKAEKKALIRMATQNALHALEQKLMESHTIAKRLHALQQLLQRQTPIERMECFDVSHTFGESTVASCVVFSKEGPLKKEYRRFNIKTAKRSDDYAAMREALMRRFTRVKAGEFQMPDVVLIDGGKGQLNCAKEVLNELEITNIQLVGVAKGPARTPGLEKLILADGIVLSPPPEDIGFHLIQQIRDEAHRFAITLHRHKRDKARTDSELERIPGVGPQKRRDLLRRFGSMADISAASVEELTTVPGISQALAERILNFLRKG